MAFSQPPLSDSGLKEGLDLIHASRDPEALMDLADFVGPQNQSRSSVLGSHSGSMRDVHAWQLAACRMGANCRANSPLLVNLCLYGGYRSACSGSDCQSALRNDALSPAEYQIVVDESTEIINEMTGP